MHLAGGAPYNRKDDSASHICFMLIYVAYTFIACVLTSFTSFTQSLSFYMLVTGIFFVFVKKTNLYNRFLLNRKFILLYVYTFCQMFHVWIALCFIFFYPTARRQQGRKERKKNINEVGEVQCVRSGPFMNPRGDFSLSSSGLLCHCAEPVIYSQSLRLSSLFVWS